MSERQLRVIGGQWRSRKISFADLPAIRPSADRVRETLFNWLQGRINGATCLELFAGSGILSIEALSRGARHTTIIDQSQDAIDSINQNLGQLKAEPHRFTSLCANAYQWLNQCQHQFDLILLDPPFANHEITSLLEIIHQQALLAPDGLIYVESGAPLQTATGFDIYRRKRAGAVHFGLMISKA